MSATCKGCGGVADYAFMDGDVICKKCLVVGAKAKPSDYARAMIEMETLRTQNQQQEKRIRELEGKNDGFNELTGLMQKSLEEDTTRIGELSDENQQLRAALVRARSQALYDAADDFESGASASDIRANADAILSGQPDGPGEEDGPWAEGWKERVGQSVEDPRDKSDCHGPDWTERDSEAIK